jgi:NodT family efflux transporter outer membrane factor (OMF) lipoprotein
MSSRPQRRVMHALALATATLVVGLAGCASTQTAYTAPEVRQPATWQQAQGGALKAEPLSPWWTTMGDPVLVKLIDEALARNNNLAQAAIKVRRAQLTAGQAASNQLPTLSLSGSGTAARQLDGGSGTTRTGTLTGSVSWEADLWGRLASLRQAADWEAQATEEDRRATALALVGTTANLYWQVAYLNQRVLASQQSIDYARRTLDLIQIQFKAGAASGLDVAQAQQTLAAQEASHTQWLQQRVVARNALAVLFDGPPGVALDESRALPEGSLPDVPAGLPASLLTRRPDLRAAELRLRGSVATVDATRTSYYPKLTLTGSVGGTSTSLAKVLSDPIGTLGAGLVLPFVQYRDMDRQVAIAQADVDSAVRGYRQSWYQALSDVENALSSRVQYEDQGVKLTQALEAARLAEKLSEARYRGGAVALKVWLDAQEARRTAENNLAQNRLNRLAALVTLYQSLGGGTAADGAQASPNAAAAGVSQALAG